MKTIIEDRECGHCFECCVHTGVDARAGGGRVALRTYPGKPCLHLRPDHPGTACAVYERRPHACERYLCVWRQGIIPEPFLRPDISGVILGFYSPDENGQPTSATITICDANKSGGIGDVNNPLGKIINFATNIVKEVKIVNYRTREVLYLHDGKVYAGKLTKPSAPEMLEFNFQNEPIGTYELKSKGSA